MESNELLDLGTLEASKANQSIIAQTFIEKVSSGQESAISMAAKAKFITDTLKEVSEAIKGEVVSEVSKYGKGEKIMALGGYSVSVRETGVKYDYSKCNHPRYNLVCVKIANLEKEKRALEDFLKAVKGHVEIADEDTGEMCTIYAPSKQSTTSPIFALK